MRAKTVQELQAEIDETHGFGAYKLVKLRPDLGRGHAQVVCSKHGRFIGIVPKSGHSCPKCKQQTHGNEKYERQFKAFRQVLDNKFAGKLTYVSDYGGSKTKCSVMCHKHGLMLMYPGVVFRHEVPCKLCRKEQATALQFSQRERAFKELCKTFPDFIFGKYVEFSRENKKYIKIHCKKHNIDFQKAHNTLHVGKPILNCPECLKEHRQIIFTKTHDEVLSQINNAHADNVVLIGKYTGARNQHTFECTSCRRTWTTTVDSVVRAKHSGCPYCGYNVSVGECELFDWVKTLFPDAKQSVRELYSTKLGKFEWDIYIPSKKIAIEFNGTYYHSYPRKPKWYHWEKSRVSGDNGIRLLHVYDDDWQNRQTVVKKTLKHLFGIPSSRYFARKLTVRRSLKLSKTMRNFYEKNHMLGAPTAGLTYGLTENMQIRALMTFLPIQSERGKTSVGHEYELVRFASIGQVVGGASRLFKSFLADVCPDRVISYSDNDLFDGGLYKVLGFNKHSEVLYDYTTVWDKRRRHKSYTRRANLAKLLGSAFDCNKSEMQNLVANKIRVVFNSGKTKWEWRK